MPLNQGQDAAYWMAVTEDRLIQIAAMAIVTSNAAVSIATRGFSVANTLRDRPLRAKPFADEWMMAVCDDLFPA